MHPLGGGGGNHVECFFKINMVYMFLHSFSLHRGAHFTFASVTKDQIGKLFHSVAVWVQVTTKVVPVHKPQPAHRSLN